MRKIRGKRDILPPVSQSDQTEPLAKPKPKRVPRPYSKSPDSQFITQAEIGKLFAVIKSPRDRSIFRVALHRGLRASEVGMLQLSDFNEKEGLLHVRREKGSISQDYQILPVEASALRAWLKIRGRDPGPLFPSRQKRAGGLGIHRNQLFRLFRGYCALAGIRPEKRHLHAIRHACATILSERGTPAELIQDWLGHKSAQATKIYTHVSARRRAEAFELNRDWR
jgi:integrase